MPGYRQNQPNVINRDPDSQRAGSHLPAYPVYAPEARQENMETPTKWSPFGTFIPQFSGNGRAAAAKRWDGLAGRLMDVPQADFYNSEPNPFPASGVWDVPNAQMAVLRLPRLRPTTSAHPGASLSTGADPTSVFHAPPVFGLQTKPITAVGL